MHLNPSILSEKDLYKLLSGTITPRPIAWVSTLNKDGLPNLAPFSYFAPISTDPPYVCFSIGPGEGNRSEIPKDTLTNIRETFEFVINVVPFSLAQAMEESSKTYQPKVDEFTEAGVTQLKSSIVKPPGVKESPIQFECKLENIIPIGNYHLVIGRVIHIYIQDIYYNDGKIDLNRLQPVGRLAGSYIHVKDSFTL